MAQYLDLHFLVFLNHSAVRRGRGIEWKKLMFPVPRSPGPLCWPAIKPLVSGNFLTQKDSSAIHSHFHIFQSLSFLCLLFFFYHRCLQICFSRTWSGKYVNSSGVFKEKCEPSTRKSFEMENVVAKRSRTRFFHIRNKPNQAHQ